MNIPDDIKVKIGEYKYYKVNKYNITVLVYWTSDGEKRCRIINGNNKNHLESGNLFTGWWILTEIEMEENEMKYWRQFVKLCDL